MSLRRTKRTQWDSAPSPGGPGLDTPPPTLPTEAPHPTFSSHGLADIKAELVFSRSSSPPAPS